MNSITKFVNHLNEWLEPLREFASNEAFRGEMLATVGAKEKDSPADKAKTKEKLTGLLKKLDDLRNWLGLDKSDIPKVDNIAALVLLLQEIKLIWDALRTALESCEFGNGNDSADATQIKITNAIQGFSKFLTLLLVKRKYPAVGAFAEATGILADEYNEVKRALYLVSTLDFLRPTGDPNTDRHQRFGKAIFLDATVLLVLLQEISRTKTFFEEHGEEMGEFLLNFGWEVPPDRDTLKHANRIASRVLQLQYVPGTFLKDKLGIIGITSSDALISFATIPVMPMGAISATTKPLGFQYLLKFETSFTDILPGGDKFSGFKFGLPARPNVSFIWGHETEPHPFIGDNFGTLPLLEMLLPGTKVSPTTSESGGASALESTTVDAETPNSVRRGDIGLVVLPKKTSDNKGDLDIRLDFRQFKLVLSGDGRDGFIQKILPDGNLTIDTSLAVGYSLRTGLYTEGLDDQDGLFFRFNIGKVFGKTLEIPLLYVGLRPSLKKDEQGKDELQGVTLEASAQLKMELGPFLVTVDRLGLGLTLDFPEKADGNAGGANLNLGLKPPTGIGFLLDAKAVKGGGFLSIDPEKGQYIGVAELAIKGWITLKAVAVILTKRPDGSKGFSFLLIVSAEFTPAIDLHFMGIRLKGVGGLVAIHRSIDLDAFREGIRDNRFDSILFPDNPVGNAPTIVSQMTTLFPFGESHYAFGLMGRLEWGSSKLVDLKLGLLIDVVNTKAEKARIAKFAIVGVMRVSVEKGDLKILRFVMNFLVAFDFEKKMLSIDAALYDSKFVQFDIKGEFYLRVIWGDEPCFLVSVGGWHPDFTPPARLQLPAKPQRIALPLINRDKVKLNLSFYAALTSNSFQFGAALDLKVKVSKFRLEAGLSLDALFRSLSDFYVNFEGKLLIFWGDSQLAGIKVKGVFSGTTPWRIRGSASFSIWIFDYDVDFDVSSGPETSELSQSVDVLPALETALRDTRNWRVTLPPDRLTHITPRHTEDDGATTANQPLRADPLARIEVVQQVVPLGVRIDKIGYERARDFRVFDLRPTDPNASAADNGLIDDFFAPGMYLDLNDAEKLSRKSFEPMMAGRSFGDFEAVSTGVVCNDIFAYEDVFYDTLPTVIPTTPTPPVATVTPERFRQLIGNGSVARSERGRALLAQREIRARQVTLGREEFVLVDTATGKPIDGVATQRSMTAGYTEKWNQSKVNPLQKTTLVRRFDN